MRMIGLMMVSAAALAGCTMEDRPEAAAAEARAAQESFAEVTRGRVAEAPVSCVNLRNVTSNRSLGRDTIMFGTRGDAVIYVNRPTGGCESLDHGRTLIVRTPTGQLCRGEIARIVDLASGIEFGACALGDFTPYRRTR